jgi:hypothetical protein
MIRDQRTGTVPILLLVLLTACSAPSKGEKQVKSFNETRDFLAEAQGQVDVTLASLTSLRRTPADRLDLAFKHYKESVTALEKEGADARWLADAMKEKSEAHIRAWQSEMETITDPKIKASLQSRRDAVRSNFNLLKLYAQDARKAYDPFLKGNQQMVQALSIDLSPAALTSLSEAMDQLTVDGALLKQRIAAMQHSLDNVAQGLSPIGM